MVNLALGYLSLLVQVIVVYNLNDIYRAVRSLDHFYKFVSLFIFSVFCLIVYLIQKTGEYYSVLHESFLGSRIKPFVRVDRKTWSFKRLATLGCWLLTVRSTFVLLLILFAYDVSVVLQPLPASIKR